MSRLADGKVLSEIKGSRGVLIDIVHRYKKNQDISLASDMKYLLETYRTHTKVQMIKILGRLRKEMQSRKKNKRLYYLVLSKKEENMGRRVRQLARAMRLVIRDKNETELGRLGVQVFQRHKTRLLKVLAVRMRQAGHLVRRSQIVRLKYMALAVKIKGKFVQEIREKVN